MKRALGERSRFVRTTGENTRFSSSCVNRNTMVFKKGGTCHLTNRDAQETWYQHLSPQVPTPASFRIVPAMGKSMVPKELGIS